MHQVTPHSGRADFHSASLQSRTIDVKDSEPGDPLRAFAPIMVLPSMIVVDKLSASILVKRFSKQVLLLVTCLASVLCRHRQQATDELKGRRQVNLQDSSAMLGVSLLKMAQTGDAQHCLHLIAQPRTRMLTRKTGVVAQRCTSVLNRD